MERAQKLKQQNKSAAVSTMQDQRKPTSLQGEELTIATQKARHDPRLLSSADVSLLQCSIGNQAVGKLIQMMPLPSRLQSDTNDNTATPDAAQAIDTDKQAVVSGDFSDKGDYDFDEASGDFKFKTPELQRVLEDSLRNWAPTIKTPTPPVGGHSGGKAIQNFPQWVKDYQEKLVIQQPITKPQKAGSVAKSDPKVPPQWNQDSEVAQHLLEAFLRAWYQQLGNNPNQGTASASSEALPAQLPGNVGELFSHVGDSRGNDRARILGSEPNAVVNNWCAPASQNALALMLMKNQWRFKKAKNQKNPNHPIVANPTQLVKASELDKQKLHAEAFKAEVTAQGAYFLTDWFTQKPGSGRVAGKGRRDPNDPNWRGVTSGKGQDGKLYGGEAYYKPLEPGDYITIVGPSSPLSGHAATVVKEIPEVKDWPATANTPPGTLLSKVYIVSGNALGIAVRVEVIEREMPPPEFDYNKQSTIGNEYDLRSFRLKAKTQTARQQYLDKLRPLFNSWTFGYQDIQNRLRAAYPNEFPEKEKDKIKVQLSKFFDRHVNVNNIDIDTMQTLFGGQGNWNQFQQIAEAYLTKMKPDIDALQVPVDEYVDEQNKNKNAYSKQQADFGKRNLDAGAQGRYVPTSGAGRIWVAGIVRSHLLAPQKIQGDIEQSEKMRDAYNHLLTAVPPKASDLLSQIGINPAKDERSDDDVTDDVLAQNGLERMAESIETLWPGAIEYWEGLGAFR